MALLAKAYAEAIKMNDIQFDILFGPAYKGIPLVTCTTMCLSDMYGLNYPFVYDRKETKDHGEGGMIVGAVEMLQGQTQARVCVLDDVLTSGTALTTAIVKIKEVQPSAKIAALVILLDRQEKTEGTDRCASEIVSAKYDTRVVSILKMDNLLQFLRELEAEETNESSKKELQKNLEDLLEYRKIYGR